MNLIPFPPPGLMLSMATTVFLVPCPGLWEPQSILSPLPCASDILSFQPTSEVVLVSRISLMVSQVVFRHLPFLDVAAPHSVTFLGVSKCFFYLSLKQNSKKKIIAAVTGAPLFLLATLSPTPRPRYHVWGLPQYWPFWVNWVHPPSGYTRPHAFILFIDRRRQLLDQILIIFGVLEIGFCSVQAGLKLLDLANFLSQPPELLELWVPHHVTSDSSRALEKRLFRPQGVASSSFLIKWDSFFPHLPVGYEWPEKARL